MVSPWQECQETLFLQPAAGNCFIRHEFDVNVGAVKLKRFGLLLVPKAGKLTWAYTALHHFLLDPITNTHPYAKVALRRALCLLTQASGSWRAKLGHREHRVAILDRS